MIDLTPLDVRKKRGDFRRVLRGYDPEEVDAFLELVEERLNDLVSENLSLAERTSRLEVSLRALEEREKAVQEALVTAQKIREQVSLQSQREVDLLKREARSDVEQLRREVEGEMDRRLLEAESLLRERQHALEELERNRRKLLKGMRTLLERELDAVEVEESRPPLEDAPLDLDLRGWRPDQGEASNGTEAGAEEAEGPAAGVEAPEAEGQGGGSAPPPRLEGPPPWLSSAFKEKGFVWPGEKE